MASLSQEVDAVRRKLNEVQTLHGQLQTKCADAKTKLDDLNKTRLAQLDGLAGIKAQVRPSLLLVFIRRRPPGFLTRQMVAARSRT